MRKLHQIGLLIAFTCLATGVASAQSFRVQCPNSTITHPAALNDVEPAYTGPTTLSAPSASTFQAPTANVNGAIKCQQISGGDGYATMGDGTQTYLFSFGPLSGLAKIASGQAGTDSPTEFNTINPPSNVLLPGDPATTDDPSGTSTPNLASFTYNGAVGQVPDLDNGGAINGHVDPRQMLDVGVMNGNIPAPLMAIDEDDEYFLTLSNVGMIMRPDLFEQHTVHFHGYPNASAFYDGVPDASVAINIGGSFTYYYLAPDAGTYFGHCHITPPEHLQMGMVGQLYVRPRQNRVPATTTLYTALQAQETDLRTACVSATDILCSNPLPLVDTTHPAPTATGGFTGGTATKTYAYKDGGGSTHYDVDYPIPIPSFSPHLPLQGQNLHPGNRKAAGVGRGEDSAVGG